MSLHGAFSSSFLLNVSLIWFCNLAQAINSEKPLQSEKRATTYAPGQTITVTCLNRTIDTGEHVTDSQGQLQYIPFPVCNETNRPLELYFGVEKDINCTLASLPDPLFHLLEFYIHNDAPLTCRIPSTPVSPSASITASSENQYTPLQIALAGTLQLSHLHITPNLNLIVHTSALDEHINNGERTGKQGEIVAATAYSIPPLGSRPSPRLIIGDPLPLRFSVRWYSSRNLPPSTTSYGGLGGHVHISTVVYCLLSLGAGVAGSWAWWRGWELPRRLRGYKSERLGGAEGGNGRGYAWPGSAGGVGSMSYSGGRLAGGKRD